MINYYLTEKPPQPVFLLHATLMIPSVIVRPSLDEVQEALTAAGKLIAGVAKGVSQWNTDGNKTGEKVPFFTITTSFYNYLKF